MINTEKQQKFLFFFIHNQREIIALSIKRKVVKNIYCLLFYHLKVVVHVSFTIPNCAYILCVANVLRGLVCTKRYKYSKVQYISSDV